MIVAPKEDQRSGDSLGWGDVAIFGGSALLAALVFRRLHRCERELACERGYAAACEGALGARAVRNATPPPLLGSFGAERAVQWFQDATRGMRRNGCTPPTPAPRVETTATDDVDPAAGATAPRDGRDPDYRVRTLVGDRCGFRAWMFWTGAPPETAKVGDVWAYVEKPQGEIVAKKKFRTQDEAWPYAKAALQRALERAGKFDCY